MSNETKRTWKARLPGALIKLGILLLVLAGAAKWWIVPAVGRSVVRAKLADLWDGPVAIEEIDFNFFGPWHVRGVTLRDAADRQWLHIKTVRLSLRGWPGPRPTLVAADIDGVKVSPHFADGQCLLPLKPSPSGPGQPHQRLQTFLNRYRDVRLTARDISIVAANETPAATTFAPTAAVGTDRWQLPGPALAAVLENVRIPAISWKDGVLVVDDVSATVCNGRASTHNLRADIQGDQSLLVSGDITAADIDMAELTRALGLDKPMEHGTGQGVLRFRISSSGVSSLRGHGAIFLDEADVYHVPVLEQLFQSLGMTPSKGDAEASFDLVWPKATIHKGRLSSLILSIKADPGGTVNIKTGDINGSIVPMPTKQARMLIGNAGVFNPLAPLVGMVFRVHLDGHWSDPPQRLITKKPMHDLAKLTDSTLDLFRSATITGGQLRGDVFKALEEMEKRLGKPPHPERNGKD